MPFQSSPLPLTQESQCKCTPVPMALRVITISPGSVVPRPEAWQYLEACQECRTTGLTSDLLTSESAVWQPWRVLCVLRVTRPCSPSYQHLEFSCRIETSWTIVITGLRMRLWGCSSSPTMSPLFYQCLCSFHETSSLNLCLRICIWQSLD